MRKLVLLFAALPLVDLYVLYRLSDVVGGGLAVAYVLAVGLVGVWLMRANGLRVLAVWRRALAEGRPPDGGVINAALVLLGCALLIVPGVISDALGVCLFVPALRRGIARRANQRVREAIERGSLHVVQSQVQPPFSRNPQRTVIDVEGEVVDSDDADRPRLGQDSS